MEDVSPNKSSRASPGCLHGSKVNLYGHVTVLDSQTQDLSMPIYALRQDLVLMYLARARLTHGYH